MRKGRVYVLLAGLAVVVSAVLMLAFIFVLTPGGTEGIRSTVALTKEVTSTGPGNPAEGIAVHGHWTIEVRNPDGTMAEHYEFENALSPTSGGIALAWTMARRSSVGGWQITLAPNLPGEGAFLNSSGSPAEGVLMESTYVGSNPNYFNNLTVGIGSGDDRNKLVLSGTATAQTSGNVGRVKTSVMALGSSQPPSSAYIGAGFNDFTETTLSSPVNLTTGQTVTVLVVISFS